VRSGDPFRRVERLAESVYAYVAYRIGPGSAAQDVTGEAFVRGWRYRSTYDPARGSPESWMIGIARRVLAERADSPEVLVGDLPDRPDPRDEPRRALDRISLDQAMQRLGDRDRELLALRYGADLTALQIAELLEIEVNTVEVALSRARVRLRAVLDDHDWEGGPSYAGVIEPTR
jgi:RNA polymerase sigma-70 factor, ECF subfamily